MLSFRNSAYRSLREDGVGVVGVVGVATFLEVFDLVGVDICMLQLV